MPALVAGIHVLIAGNKDVDGRDKPGHDAVERSWPAAVWYYIALPSPGAAAWMASACTAIAPEHRPSTVWMMTRAPDVCAVNPARSISPNSLVGHGLVAMAPRNTGPGKFFIKIDKGFDVIRAWLYNFDIDGWALKTQHTNVLDRIGLAIQDGGGVKLLGLASTTGTAAHDKVLSDQRLQEVVRYLRSNFGNKFVEGKEHGWGKVMALVFHDHHLLGGTSDNTESDYWRGVVVNARNRGLPPPPPVGVDLPFNNSTWATKLDGVLNVVAIDLGLIDFTADIAEIAAVTEVTGIGGLFITCVQGMVAMPVMWASADAIAEFNGQVQGAADAIQDMADQFAADSLDRTPMSNWPAIQIPALHIPPNPQPNASQAVWRAGQARGRMNVVRRVALELEQHPRPITLPDGKHFRLSGRLWLRIASKVFKDNVGVVTVIKPTNDELRKQGRPPFPTH